MARSSGASTAPAIASSSSAAARAVVDVAGGEHDLDRRPRASSGGVSCPRLSSTMRRIAADGGVDLALGEPQQREPGRRLAPVLAGRPVRPLGVGAARRAAGAARPAGRARGRARDGPARTDAALARSASATASAHSPCACSTCDRCTRHWPRYGTRSGWPAHQPLERLGPLGRPPQVEHVHARLDDRAVDDPGRDRRDLAGRHRHHHLVEQAHAVARSRPSASAAWPRPSRPSASRSLSSNRRAMATISSGERRRPSLRHRCSSASRNTGTRSKPRAGARRAPTSSSEPRGAGEPPARLRHLAPEQEADRQPAGAPRRPVGIAAPGALEVRPLPRPAALLVATDQVGGDGEPLEVVGLQRVRTPPAARRRRPTPGGRTPHVRARPRSHRTVSTTRSRPSTRHAARGIADDRSG